MGSLHESECSLLLDETITKPQHLSNPKIYRTAQFRFCNFNGNSILI